VLKLQEEGKLQSLKERWWKGGENGIHQENLLQENI
jgi:hypothetical protein